MILPIEDYDRMPQATPAEYLRHNAECDLDGQALRLYIDPLQCNVEAVHRTSVKLYPVLEMTCVNVQGDVWAFTLLDLDTFSSEGHYCWYRIIGRMKLVVLPPPELYEDYEAWTNKE